jgi:hypothetical protein
MNRLKRSRIVRSAIVAGGLFIGCASSQVPQKPPEKPPIQPVVQKKEKGPNCLQKRTRIQECLIEAAFKSCKGSKECIVDQLKQDYQFPGEKVNLSIDVMQGDEVLSLRTGGSIFNDIVRLEVASVDSKGVTFRLEFSCIDLTDLESRKVIDEATFRMNFDGELSGDAWKFNPIEVWNFRVEESDDGAKVSFSTADNRILVRGQEIEENNIKITSE